MNFMVYIFLVYMLSLCKASLLNQLKLKVSTSSGILTGTSSIVLNKTVRKFLGVKYGISPIGIKRFKMPQEYIEPESIKEVTNFKPSCWQPAHILSVISPLLPVNNSFSEDCLYLNVFIPSTDNPETPLPVMVFLPGEGFDYADPQQYDGSYLAAMGGTIVVTINYRVSLFGFLSTNSEEAPGNVGLHDQRLALRWIKKNILNFGGNPNKITLLGRFTGGMSAAIHAFSPLSLQEKLFNNVILQSGIPVGDWVFDKNPVKTTSILAEKLECEISDEQSMLSCIRQKPADILLDAAMQLKERFRPIYDEILILQNQSISKMNFSPINYILGMNSYEGSLCTIALKATNSSVFSKLMTNSFEEEDFNELLEKYLEDFYKIKNSLSTKITTFKYKSINKPRDRFLQFCGDIFIKSHTLKMCQELSNQGLNVFMYNFAHRPSFSIHPSFIGAAHGDDVLFSLGLPMSISNISSEEARLTRRIVEAFSNFAKKGDPNPIEGENIWPDFKRSHKIMTFDVARDGVYIQSKPVEENNSVELFHEILPAVQARECVDGSREQLH